MSMASRVRHESQPWRCSALWLHEQVMKRYPEECRWIRYTAIDGRYSRQPIIPSELYSYIPGGMRTLMAIGIMTHASSWVTMNTPILLLWQQQQQQQQQQKQKGYECIQWTPLADVQDTSGAHVRNPCGDNDECRVQDGTACAGDTA